MITITHCTDTKALIAEVKAKLPEYEKDGKFLIREKKPHSVKNNGETLNRCRFSDKELEMVQKLENLTLLGDYEDVFSDPAKKEIYDRVYQQTFTYKDEDGKEQTGTKPKEFSRFLGEKY